MTCSASGSTEPVGKDTSALSDTLFGFFPSPPKITYRSVVNHYKTMGEHADIVLYQNEVPWEDFVESVDVESQSIEDSRNQLVLADRENLEALFVIDPLNGLNRREFSGLPDGWPAEFRNPRIRAAFRNYTLRIVREFHPKYLGLASEINTYADAFPEDFPYYMSLYEEVYESIKIESPETRVFVTFQWEDLNNLWPQPWEEDYKPGEIKWDQIEQFEPNLDLWVISSYPYIVYQDADEIPADYYSPLLDRTNKPLALAEGGWISEDYLHRKGQPEDQVGYLTAIADQIGDRLDFWVYLLARDIDINSYAAFFSRDDLETLKYFTTVGLIDEEGEAKPALTVWDSLRD